MTATAAVVREVVHDAPRAPLAPVDPAVVLPASVRAGAERAENYYKKPVEPAPQDGQQPPVAGEPAPPAPPEPAAEVTGAGNEPAPPPAPVVDPNDQTWEHKYKSIHGRFTSQSAHMRQMQEQMSELSNELVATQRRLDETQRVMNAPAPQRLVTDEERTEYGSEFIDVAARAAREALDPQVAAVMGEVTELKTTLHKQAVRGVYSELTAAVPDWQIVNRHPNFNRWLGLRDPMSGAIRKVLLDSAFRAADAARVVSIFRSFVTEEAAQRPAEPAPQPSPTPAVPAAGRVPAVSLETLAAPGRASSAPAGSTAAEKPIYTQRNISQFYEDVRKGGYIGRDADKNAREQDIFAAQREGRVRG